MKKLLFVLLLSVKMHVMAAPVALPEVFEVFDFKTNEVLASRSADKLHSIASLTKLMTAHVFLKYYKGDVNNCVTSITADDTDTIKNTRTRIDKYKSISCMNLLQIMLLASDNYAASAIAGSIPLVSKYEFYKLMNQESRNLGMRNTFFKDSSGLSFQNKSTATDLLKLTKVLMENEQIKDLSTSYGVNLQSGNKNTVFKNSNKLIRDDLYSAELSKTGYISESGYNLIFVPKGCQNKNIGIVIMGAKSSTHRANFAKNMLERYSCTKN